MRGRVLTRSLQWDESNLTLNEEERELAGARMTIDEPKTPFVHSAPAPPMEEERTWCAADAAFDLDHDEEPPTSLDSDKVQANTQANAAISASYQQLKEQLAASSAPPMRGDGDDDEEDATKHAEFNRKRNRHYGNEAAALKQGAALAAEDDDA